jgi:2-oxoglutarate dehydrogenase E2 component (dihydrolipoamide succinyltransferase)
LHEPLLELETDKVTVEVPAPAAGVLEDILKGEGDDVELGELLGHIAASDHQEISEERPASDSSLVSAAVAHPLRRDACPVISAQSRPGVADISAPAGMGSMPPPAARPDAPAAYSVASVPASAVKGATAAAVREGNRGPAAHMLSPAVRRLLSEHSLDASSIDGSGEGGRITVQDVLRAAAEHREALAASPKESAQTAAADASEDGALDLHADGVRRVPHSAVRKRIAEHMTRSLLHTAPHVTTVFEADMSAVLRHRAKHRDSYANAGVPLTLTAYFVQACVSAIREVPEINSRWTSTALEIFDSIHVGIATALEDELVVPVLRCAESLDLAATARQLDELTRRAREHRLTPAEVRGGTFTISNHGVSGSLLAAPIVINQPQSAILGIGKLEKRAIVEEASERISVQPRCYVTLTIDHRVLDGQRANRFLQTFVARLASWPET